MSPASDAAQWEAAIPGLSIHTPKETGKNATKYALAAAEMPPASLMAFSRVMAAIKRPGVPPGTDYRDPQAQLVKFSHLANNVFQVYCN